MCDISGSKVWAYLEDSKGLATIQNTDIICIYEVSADSTHNREKKPDATDGKAAASRGAPKDGKAAAKDKDKGKKDRKTEEKKKDVKDKEKKADAGKAMTRDGSGSVSQRPLRSSRGAEGTERNIIQIQVRAAERPRC